MTKIEALELIDSVLSQVSLPRAGHEKLREAIEFLRSDES